MRIDHYLQGCKCIHTYSAVDAMCIKAYTSSQFFKTESDCFVNIHGATFEFYWLFFTVLDLNALLFALFSVNMKLC